MNKIGLIVFLLCLSGLLLPMKLADLPELTKYPEICVNDNQIYIIDFPNIHIYSLKPFKHIKQFGKEGVGPGEFRDPTKLKTISDKLVVISPEKVIVFSSDGELANEFKTSWEIKQIYPVGKNYVGTTFEQKRKSINIYDNSFKIIKNIYKGPLGQSIFITSDFSKKQDIIAIKDYVSYQVYEDQIYFGDTKKGFFFTVFDKSGNTVNEVNIKYKKLLITDEYKSGYFKWKSKYPNWERYKKRYNYVFPKFFPAFRQFKITDNKAYFITYKNTGSADEVIITDLNGNLIKKSSFPSDPYDRTGSIDICKGVVYYLFENEDEEMWELHAADL